MAKKKTASKKPPQATQVLSRLQGNLKKLQRDAEALLGRTRKQASQLISRNQKRALDRLFGQAQRLRSDLEKRAQRASKDVEARAERFLSTLEKEASKRLDPVLRRLDLPSRQEVHSLSRRIGQLERRLRTSRPSAASASATSPSTAALAEPANTPPGE